MNKYNIDISNALLGRSDLERREEPLVLPEIKTCGKCSHVHRKSELVAVIDTKKKQVWFQCFCGSTLMARCK